MRTATIRSHSPGLLLATVLLLGGALLFGGCRGSGTSGPGASPATSPAGASTSPSTLAQAGTEEGARELLVQFVKPGADTAALTKTLMPTDADYLAVFDESSVTGAREHYAKMWASMGSGIAPKDGQTEVILTSATTSDFRTATAKAREFPGGWKRVAPRLKEGVTWYRFKFVKPKSLLGMAFDGLTFVNGHWAFFPKPWRAIKDK